MSVFEVAMLAYVKVTMFVVVIIMQRSMEGAQASERPCPSYF